MYICVKERAGTGYRLRVEGFEHRTEQLGDVRLHYVVGGSGDIVVLLQGWSQTWYEWRRIMPALAGERALTISQAFAIVENRPIADAPTAGVGIGIYLGLVASCVLVLFGLTIVVKRAQTVYTITSPDDDVD